MVIFSAKNQIRSKEAASQRGRSYANGPRTVVVDAVRTIIIRSQSMTELVDETSPKLHILSRA
jgi:hypothetical protein